MNLIDWILDLFRSEDVARSFVAAPEQTLRDDTSVASHNDSSLDNSHELALASGNHLPGF